MTARQVREPKLGEVVGASGHRGVFRIIAINSASRTADLKLIGGTETEICGVPWTTLTQKSREDANQAAFRVVREATKD